MANSTMTALLGELRRRNDELSAAYRSISKRTLSRSLTTLAASAAEQRRELGETLADIMVHLDETGPGEGTDLPSLPLAAKPSEALASNDPAWLLRYFRDIEDGDKDLFSVLASIPGLEPDLAARFAALSNEARKRAAIANGHLDLLSLG